MDILSHTTSTIERFMKHTIEMMISEQEINKTLDQLAERINAHYADSERLLMVGLLKGSVVFMAD